MGRASSLTIRGPTPYPDRMFLKLKYTQQVANTHAAGATSFYEWRGNSIFDPDLTGTGHKPFASNQWTNFYSQYCVHGSSIKVQAIITTNTFAAMNIAVIPLPQALNPSAGDLATPIEEMNYVKYKLFNTYNQDKSLIKHYMSTTKMAGYSPKDIQYDSTLRAAIGANPSAQWTWQVYLQPADESTAISTVTYVTITYYVELSNVALATAS